MKKLAIFIAVFGIILAFSSSTFAQDKTLVVLKGQSERRDFKSEQIESVVPDAQDGGEYDHVDWGNVGFAKYEGHGVLPERRTECCLVDTV